MPAPDQNRDSQEALTSIPMGIHCAATEEPNPDEDTLGELDEIDIDHFITTLAEVAMAVATRRLTKKRDAE